MDMFCYQCQETARNTGCTRRGVCGKSPEVSALLDAVIYLLQGLSTVAVAAEEVGLRDRRVDDIVMGSLFRTITNVNFDKERYVELAIEVLALRDDLLARVEAALPNRKKAWPAPVTWTPRDHAQETFLELGIHQRVTHDPNVDEDVVSLRSLLLFGLKGLAAYTDHANVLGAYDDDISRFVHEALALIANDEAGADELVAASLKCGEIGVKAMALLDGANTGAYGDPEPTMVNLGVVPGPAILISGHDLRDLSELLEQTAGKGVNVYTHGEMLPANAYPAFKRYDHLIGNYGSSWWHQPDEFETFGGAILMTTNCLVPPKDSYIDRLFTTGQVGWPGVPHLADRVDDQPKDFSAVIEKALTCPGPQELEQGSIPIGFAHKAVLSVADKVIEAIQAGAIKRFVVMAGCDGRQKGRDYFTEVAQGLPEDSVILTAGCAKYRYNKLDLGDIGGIPRVLDAGQCNDSYSLVVVALGLAEALGIEDINDLPIEYDIAWYEQKAVLVLLALLSLGVKRIRLGPTLPAFLSPNVTKVLVEKFDIRPTATVEEDLASIVAGA